MIPYSLNNEVRKKTTVILVLLSVCITIGIENVIIKYFNNFKFLSEFFDNIYLSIEYELLLAVAIPPFIVWYGLNLIYSKCIWKFSLCQLFHHVPDLNGKWSGYTANDKMPDKKRPVIVTIKQDWNNIGIKTEIMDSHNTESFCECTVAAIDVNCGTIILKYVYKNGLLEDKSYIGYNELDVDVVKGKITGKYMTSKPTKGIFEISK